MSLQSQAIYVAESPIQGRGVFAGQDIAAGDVIEICPVIVMKPEDRDLLDKTVLYDYYFLWDDPEAQNDTPLYAICMGFGSFYNHWCPSNADYSMDFDNLTIDMVAVRDIKEGEEITINYNGDPDNAEKTWFME